MNQVERDLHESMRRRQPPPGFAEKVIARTDLVDARRFHRKLITVAALVLLMIGGGALVEMQRRHAEGERAKEQLMVALQITGSKFQDIRDRLNKTQQRSVQPQSNK